jgi:hypothetical protein
MVVHWKKLYWIGVSIFSTTLLWNTCYSKGTDWNMIKMRTGCHTKWKLILSHVKEAWFSKTDFSKNLKLNFITIRQFVLRKKSCSMWTYGQMDRHYEANGRFSKFCEREGFLQTKFIKRQCTQLTSRNFMWLLTAGLIMRLGKNISK